MEVTAQVFLKPKKEESLLRFHPWIFSGAIRHIIGNPKEGDVVEVYTASNEFIALGIIRLALSPFVSFRSIRLISTRSFGMLGFVAHSRLAQP